MFLALPLTASVIQVVKHPEHQSSASRLSLGTCLRRGRQYFTLSHVPGDENPARIFTKPLGGMVEFAKFVRRWICVLDFVFSVFCFLFCGLAFFLYGWLPYLVFLSRFGGSPLVGRGVVLRYVFVSCLFRVVFLIAR